MTRPPPEPILISRQRHSPTATTASKAATASPIQARLLGAGGLISTVSSVGLVWAGGAAATLGVGSTGTAAAAGSDVLTGARNRNPQRGRVSINRGVVLESPRASRSLLMLILRL